MCKNVTSRQNNVLLTAELESTWLIWSGSAKNLNSNDSEKVNYDVICMLTA